MGGALYTLTRTRGAPPALSSTRFSFVCAPAPPPWAYARTPAAGGSVLGVHRHRRRRRRPIRRGRRTYCIGVRGDMAKLGAGGSNGGSGGSMPIQGPRSPELWRVAVIANASAIPRIHGCVCAVASREPRAASRDPVCGSPFTEPRMFATPWLSYRTLSPEASQTRFAVRGSRSVLRLRLRGRADADATAHANARGREMERRPYVRRPRLWPCQKEPPGASSHPVACSRHRRRSNPNLQRCSRPREEYLL